MYSVDFEKFADIPSVTEWDSAFYGTHDDDRDKATKSYLTSKAQSTIEVAYDEEELAVTLNGELKYIHELQEIFSSLASNKIVVDATSTSVAELYIIVKHLYLAGCSSIDVIYTEPQEYTKEKDDFQLSEYGMGFSGNGIPSLTFPQMERKLVVFLLGYEGDRFSDALETLQVTRNEVQLFFGVPSYKINWEKNSYLGNLKTIVDNQLNNLFTFAPANNPRVLEKKILELFDYCKKSKAQLVLVPIGTKPLAIGALKLVSEYDDGRVCVLWDQPRRKKGRTSGVGKISLIKGIF